MGEGLTLTIGCVESTRVIHLEVLTGRWGAVRQLTDRAEQIAAENTATPCSGLLTGLLDLALASVQVGFERAAALVGGLAALGDDRIEAEAQRWTTPGTYVEPFALRRSVSVARRAADARRCSAVRAETQELLPS